MRFLHPVVVRAFAGLLALTTLGCVRDEGRPSAAAERVSSVLPGGEVVLTQHRGASPEAPSHTSNLPHSAEDSFGLSRTSLWARWNSVRGDSYELDDFERFLETRGKRVKCDSSGLVRYAGTSVRYHGALQINEHFQTRLERFEEVVAEVGREVYGRAPRRIRHLGAYACRTSRNRVARLSEHALGNALDVQGFDFGPLPKTETFDTSLPKSLKHPFEVRVARHWSPKNENAANAVHARFLRSLVDRLLERSDVFRGHVGPGHPGHDDHFHFDMSPWRFVRL